MRTRWMALAVICAATNIVHADTAKAKAANTRGIALHKKKKYKEAAVEYRAAIAEDPSYMLAHYNLACVASLTKDADTALRELAWVADRSTWDDAAKKAAAKARTDKDLKWARDNQADALMLTGTETADRGVFDLTNKPTSAGSATSDAKLLRALAGAPGKHEAKCSAAALGVAFDGTKGGTTVVVSPRDGVALIDPTGALTARSEPLGCASEKDQVTLLKRGPDAGELEYNGQSLSGTKLFVVQYAKGAAQSVAVFAVKDKKLVRAFDGVVTNDAGAAGSIYQTPLLGNLLYTAPGEKQARVLRWDGASSTFVPETP